MMKDELGGVSITNFFGISSKCIHLKQVMAKQKRWPKEPKHCVIKRNIKFEYYSN